MDNNTLSKDEEEMKFLKELDAHCDEVLGMIDIIGVQRTMNELRRQANEIDQEYKKKGKVNPLMEAWFRGLSKANKDAFRKKVGVEL